MVVMVFRMGSFLKVGRDESEILQLVLGHSIGLSLGKYLKGMDFGREQGEGLFLSSYSSRDQQET